MGLYPSDKQFTVSWQAAAGTAGSRSGGGKLLQTSQHVLSGGYCCETLTSSTAVSRPQPVVSHYIVSPVTNSPPLFGDSAAMTYCTGPTTTTTATVTTPGNMASLSLHGLTGNRQLLATPTAAATGKKITCGLCRSYCMCWLDRVGKYCGKDRTSDIIFGSI